MGAQNVLCVLHQAAFYHCCCCALLVSKLLSARLELGGGGGRVEEEGVSTRKWGEVLRLRDREGWEVKKRQDKESYNRKACILYDLSPIS